MQLANWFNTSTGESLRLAENRVLATLLRQLPGEVAVCATMLNGCEHLYRDVKTPLKVTHRPTRVAQVASCDPQVVGSLSALPYTTGAVDAFVLQHGLETEADHLACIGEIARVLGEGGRAIVFALEPWGGIGVRHLLGKLPSTSLLDPLVIDCARLITAGFLKRAFAREGLLCERQRRVYGTRVSAILTELTKQRRATQLLGKATRQPISDELGLVGATSTRGSEA